MLEALKKEAQNRYGADMQINWEKTREIEKLPKYVNYLKWCDDNGILHPACRYPVAFGEQGELIGISATRDIGVNEAYIYVPTKCIINESKFQKDPQIGHMIDKYPELFEDRENCDHMKLIFFVMHELGKVKDSFWASYFETAELPDLLA